MNKEEAIAKYYYDETTGYQSAPKLYAKLKDDGHKITLKDIKEYLAKQEVNQIFKQVKKPKEYNTIKSIAPRNNYQMDILVYDRYEYNKYKYILILIDVYSRYVIAKAMTNRKMQTIMANVKDMFKELGEPKNLNCDNEFNTHEFNNYLKSRSIIAWYSDVNESNKNSIVERFNRTIAMMIAKYREATGKHDWNNVLPKLIRNYNNTIHSTTKEKPVNLFEGKTSTKQKHKTLTSSLKQGDKVRKQVKKQTFDKGDVIKFSKEIYTIVEVNKNRFTIMNSKGETLKTTYKEYDLLKVTEVQQNSKIKDNKEVVIHKQTQSERTQTRKLNKEGINKENIISTTRVRAPAVNV